MPLDPNDLRDDPNNPGTEYSWGDGIFPPGIASGEGQSRGQDNFGDNLDPPMPQAEGFDSNYARAVADRRTDTTDPESTRDFEVYGNPDRYGKNPALIKADPQKNERTIFPEYGRPPLQRRK